MLFTRLTATILCVNNFIEHIYLLLLLISIHTPLLPMFLIHFEPPYEAWCYCVVDLTQTHLIFATF